MHGLSVVVLGAVKSTFPSTPMSNIEAETITKSIPSGSLLYLQYTMP